MLMHYIDFHTHKPKGQELIGSTITEIVSVYDDNIPSSHVFTIGYHPWFQRSYIENAQLDRLVDIYLNRSNCLGIGECGLDRLISADMDMQISNFTKQVELANDLKAPVIVHCVRAYDILIKLYRTRAKTPWVIHGYKRNIILAKQITDLGIWLSIAPDEDDKDVFKEVVRSLDIQKIFIETDSHPNRNIIGVYDRFCMIKDIEVSTLCQQIEYNCNQFFLDRWTINFG